MEPIIAVRFSRVAARTHSASVGGGPSKLSMWARTTRRWHAGVAAQTHHADLAAVRPQLPRMQRERRSGGGANAPKPVVDLVRQRPVLHLQREDEPLERGTQQRQRTMQRGARRDVDVEQQPLE